jgi:hypothetical protein
LPQHFKGISGGAIWTLSGFVLVACGGGGGGAGGLSGGGSSIPPQVITLAGATFIRESGDARAITATDDADLIIDYTALVAIRAGRGDDWVFASSGSNRGEDGDDVLFAVATNAILSGNAGNDALFNSEDMRGNQGNDLVAFSGFFDSQVRAVRQAVMEGDITETDSNTRFSFELPAINVFDLPAIEGGGLNLNGDAGNDLIFAYARSTSSDSNILRGDDSVASADDGNDLIIAHSHSSITGGGGDDTFWLRPDRAGDIFTIWDFGTENSGQGAVGDRFLIVVADSVKVGLGDNPTLDAILTAAGWGTPTQSNADTQITVTATIGEVEGTYMIHLRNYTLGDLEADDFLILTQSETRDYITGFVEDNNIAPNIDIL